MKILTLRRWDIWIGRPVCWVITLLYKAKKVFVKKGLINDPGKILFIKLFGMGSIVLAYPSVAAVKKKYPEASLYFLTFRENEEVLRLTDIIPAGHILSVRKDSLPHLLADVTRSLFYLVRERIDVVIDFEFFSRFTAILSFLIRSRFRIGFYGYHTEGLKRGSFIDFQINYNHTLHTSKVFFTLLRPLGIHQEAFEPRLPQLRPSEGFREKIENTLGKANAACRPDAINRWVIINPNTSDLIELRKWPAGHFVGLTGLLLADDASTGIIFIGSKEERGYVESISGSFEKSPDSSRVINIAGMTSIRELIDLFLFADLFITNDSGPAHLAALSDIGSIVLFGPETPALYSPLGGNAHCLYSGLDCQPCVTVYNGKNSFCRDNICLKQIDPDYVFGLAKQKFIKTDRPTPSPEKGPEDAGTTAPPLSY